MKKRLVLCLLSALLGLVLLTTWTSLPSLSAVQESSPMNLIEQRSSLNLPRERAYPYPENISIQTQDLYTLCVKIYTGTIRSRYTISNPEGVSGFYPYHLVNFDQRLLGQSDTSIDIEITSKRYVDTLVPFPIDIGLLPGDIHNYLLPEPWIQSDDPLIIAKSNELVSRATTQAEAVDEILSWVRSNIAYDFSFSLPNDASSVFRNRSGVCSGFSNLTVALLRASGIPSRVHVGCVTKWGWAVGDGGGAHAWIETYYPDVGWVASDPQDTENFVDTSHIFAGFDQCGETGSVISQTEHQDDFGLVYVLRTDYTESLVSGLSVASNPSWDRHPLKNSPETPGTMIPISNPTGSISLQVENISCGSEDWKIKTDAIWLTPTIITGTTAGKVNFTIEADGMDTRLYRSEMTIYSTSSLEWDGFFSRTITVKLWLVENVYNSYLPFTSGKN